MNLILDKNVKVKPLIKWAGGKTWLLKKLQSIVPKNFNNYHEPFLGGASVFINLDCDKTSFLYDSNEELINFYTQVKTNHLDILKEASQYDSTEEFYYRLRSENFNDNIKRAARFYYLNQTCFNGLYRVNQSGLFNVPYGKPKKAFSPDPKCFEILKNRLKNAHIECNDFHVSIEKIRKNDLVFLDPPYTVAHNYNGFIEYNKKLFSWQDQERLANYIKEIKEIGAYFILTNANHLSTYNLYKELGYTEIIERYSTIGGKATSRKLISELLISNCQKMEINCSLNTALISAE